MTISFHLQHVKYKLAQKRALKAWITACVGNENKVAGDLNIILCSDQHLLEMNKQFLEHDFYTDIITFNYNTQSRISGDLFISIERVKDNATKLNISIEHELQRVIIHGVMHLCGYKDKKISEQILMRNQEDKCLNIWIQRTWPSVSRGTKLKK